jgi:hypothetical protein
MSARMNTAWDGKRRNLHAREVLAAYSTIVRFVTRVNMHVPTEMFLSRERLRTDAAGRRPCAPHCQEELQKRDMTKRRRKSTGAERS